MQAADATRLLSGLSWPECPRWHDDRLFFSDMHSGRVCSATAEGRIVSETTLPNVTGDHSNVLASGLGFTRDGRILAVSMLDRLVLAIDAKTVEVYADLREVTANPVNDMIVFDDGRAYVSQFGYDIFNREAHRAAPLIEISEEGSARAAEQFGLFEGANGMAQNPLGDLFVAETFANRVSLVRGSVPATFAETPSLPDGICSDLEGGLWVGLPEAGMVSHYSAGGGLVRTVRLPPEAGKPVACVLGGEDLRTLFICCGWHPLNHEKSRRLRNGSIWSIRI